MEDGTDYKSYLQDANSLAIAQELEENEILEEEIIGETSENTTNYIDEETTSTNENVTEVFKESGSTIVSANQIVILCAMFGVTIAVTSLVTIALVNRKKK